MSTTITPTSASPELEVDTLGDRVWRLGDQRPDSFTMLVFYRGHHCPVCTQYIGELGQKVEEFRSRGVEVIALSGDSRERADQSREEWGLDGLTVGFGLSPDVMRQWGLFVSQGITEKEPAHFGEPGLFLIAPDQTVFYEGINSMPFGRPKLDDMIDAVDFVKENDYPARGAA